MKKTINYSEVGAFVSQLKDEGKVAEIVNGKWSGPKDGVLIIGYPHVTAIGAQPLGTPSLLRLAELPELHCVAYVREDCYELVIEEAAPEPVDTGSEEEEDVFDIETAGLIDLRAKAAELNLEEYKELTKDDLRAKVKEALSAAGTASTSE